jgi:hypothetical protein
MDEPNGDRERGRQGPGPDAPSPDPPSPDAQEDLSAGAATATPAAAEGPTAPSATSESSDSTQPDGQSGVPSGWIVPDEEPVAPRRRFVRVALVAALAVVVVVVALIFIGASQTPFDRFTHRMSQQLLADPAFKSQYGSVSNDAAFQAGIKLTQDGGGRVDDATRLAFTRSISRLLALADVETCAAMAKGTAQPDKVAALVKKLDEPALNEYGDAFVKTALASVHGDPKKPLPSNAAQATAFQSWSAALGGDQKFTEMTDVLENPGRHSSAEVCAAERQLFDTAIVLPEADRSTVLLVLYLAAGQ